MTERDGHLKGGDPPIIRFLGVYHSHFKTILHTRRGSTSPEPERITTSSGRPRAQQRVIKTTLSESANWTTEGDGTEPGDKSQPTEKQQH